MLSKTLQDGLNDYEIGAKIRALRLKKKIGLVDLGKHTGLSAALLSKIERGRLFPTLPTLLRIALVFGVGLEFFFAGAREKPLVAVTRKDQRVELPERPAAREAAYRFASLDYPATERRFNCYYAEFFPVAGEKLRPHDHAGVEFIYVIDGSLTIHMSGEDIRSRRATPSTSIRAFRMRIDAAVDGNAARSSSPPPDARDSQSLVEGLPCATRVISRASLLRESRGSCGLGAWMGRVPLDARIAACTGC